MYRNLPKKVVLLIADDFALIVNLPDFRGNPERITRRCHLNKMGWHMFTGQACHVAWQRTIRCACGGDGVTLRGGRLDTRWLGQCLWVTAGFSGRFCLWLYLSKWCACHKGATVRALHQREERKMQQDWDSHVLLRVKLGRLGMPSVNYDKWTRDTHELPKQLLVMTALHAQTCCHLLKSHY